MKQKAKKLPIFQIAAGLLIIVVTLAVYIGQLNQAATFNMIHTISELVQHDIQNIESFIETCWENLDGIGQRFKNYQCRTILEVESRMNLERATSNFSHIYLLAEDGTIYTDKYVVYRSGQDPINRGNYFLSCFSDGQKRIVTRWDDQSKSAGISREYILYGVLLNNFEVEGVNMRALIGLIDINILQERVIFDCFTKNGVHRGSSAVINLSGDYMIDTQKVQNPDKPDNLCQELRLAQKSDLTETEVIQKIQAFETFSFHYIEQNGSRKLLYFAPFEQNIPWYFLMSVENRAFTELSRKFILLSISMLLVVTLVAVVLMLALSASHRKSVQAIAQARAQSEFLSNMSHEIRTPLNGLIGLNHLIQSNIDKPEERKQIKDWLYKSQSTANYLLSLVNNILDISKLQAGKVDLIQEPLLVETLIDAIWSMQHDNIESRGIQFLIQQDISVPCVMGDSVRIKQILMNIVGNAAKFTPEGGVITLSVKQEPIDDYHVNTIYACQDTGIGMSAEFTAKIFDAFSQERNKNLESVKGTGLGMAISKLLVDAMGGQICVESELDIGTTLTVTLPSEIAQSKPAYLDQHTCETAAEVNALAQSIHEDGQPIKILMAEDNELNAEILLEILGEEGFEVVHAQNGQEAVKYFAESEINEFDIILMDMQMPVMDGCSASIKIRQLDRPDAKSVLIFACTANTFQEDQDRAMKSGMNDFLAKPIDIKILLKKLNADHIRSKKSKKFEH